MRNLLIARAFLMRANDEGVKSHQDRQICKSLIELTLDLFVVQTGHK
jgi:hypothetical protein